VNHNTPWRTTRGSRIVALAQGHNDWYKIKNLAEGPAQVSIYDEIGFFGITAHDFVADLAGVEGPIDVHLNSPGGEVNDGLAIYNCLMAREGVTIYIDGIAASIASVIAMAGDTIRIAKTGQIMVHNAFTMAIGDAADLRAMADRLDENTTNIAGIYAERTGKPADHWLAVMKEEGWYRGQEAVDAGLADELTETKSKGKAATSFDMSVYHQPTANAVIARGSAVKDAASHPYHSQTETSHEPVTGIHSHNHAAFGHSDHDDGIHNHSHMHSNDAVHEHGHLSHDHGHQHDHPHVHAHEVGMESYGPHDHTHTHHDVAGGSGDDDTSQATDHDHDAWAATGTGVGQMGDHVHGHALMNTSFDASAWDGGAAMKACTTAADFNAICAGKRDGDPATREAHALPHHKHPGSPPNRAGVNNALARIGGTQGLTNKDAAEAHLKAHQRAWASESSDLSDTELFSEADAAVLANLLKG
jgi:ATP-dependent protease ClpP protease subunit